MSHLMSNEHPLKFPSSIEKQKKKKKEINFKGED